MTAIAYDFRPDFMEGIPELIEEWIDRTGGSQKDLADASGVSPKTITRWKDEKNVPDVDRATKRDNRASLAEALEVPIERVNRAAAVSRDRINDRQKDARTGVPASFDRQRWLGAVQADQNLSEGARDVLEAFTAYFVTHDLVRVTWARLAEEWELDLAAVKGCRAEVLASGYVERVTQLDGWVFKLVVPR